MPTIQLPFEAILEATEQLDARQLEVLVQRATELQQHHVTTRQREEKRLLSLWQQPTLPPHERVRVEELCRRLEDEQISESERQELLRLNEKGNDVQVQRLQAVVDLAHLRGIEPAALLAQLQPQAK